ncbi:MAG: phosphoribosylglycinamide formyltransferase [Actinobacteria bacterium]|nr:phosphoribosylglycinamide formyltransferase [Actinomycetota bacterium]
MKRIAVFASGFGSNLQALLEYEKNNKLSGKIVLVFSNNIDAYALRRAEKSSIKTICFSPSDFTSRNAFDKAIIEMLENEQIDLVVLAGYMLLAGKALVSKYKNRMINIHPALLPAFKGTHGIRDAYNYGVKVTGVTVHFIDEGLDSGPVIIQEPVTVNQHDTIEMLEEKIHTAEHRLYPLAVKYFCQDRLKIVGRKVIIEGI